MVDDVALGRTFRERLVHGLGAIVLECHVEFYFRTTAILTFRSFCQSADRAASCQNNQ